MQNKCHRNDKKHAKSFSTQPVISKQHKKVEPLTRSFFSQLVKLETAFYNKQYTASTLDELCQYYAKAVEYYDTIKDEISSYFIFKIQDALATKKSLKLLIEETSKGSDRKGSLTTPAPLPQDGIKRSIARIMNEEGKRKNEVIQENIEEESSGEEEDEEEDPAVKEFAKKRKAYLAEKNKKAKASFSTMRNQKQRFVNFFHKMENQKVQHKQNVSTMLDDFNCASKENDMKIQNDLIKQKERLREMIDQRKQRSLMTQTLNGTNSYFLTNKSMFNLGDGFSRRDVSEVNLFDDMLKDLDDMDEGQTGASGLAETGIESMQEDTVLISKSVKTIENTPKTLKTKAVFKESNVKTGSLIGEALELSPIVSSEVGEEKLNKTETDSETPIKILFSQDTKICSDDLF